MTRNEFFKSNEMKKTRATINGCAFCGYAIAIAGVILNYVYYKTINTILDAVIIIAACLCILPGGQHGAQATFGRVIAVRRRCGLGSRIVAEAIRLAQEQFAAQTIYLEAQTYAVGLYEKQGFHRVGEEFLEDGIPHVGMLLTLPPVKA